MPEGPSLIILKEQAQQFKGKKIIAVDGNTKVEKNWLIGKKIVDFKTWGKHFLICFDKRTIKIHLMLFGSYRINERREMTPRLSLRFKNGEMNFYACSVKILEGDLDEIYDWSGDVMSDEWDAKAAKKKLNENPEMLACDALLDQNIFAGSGNIIKNEVLYRVKIHPASHIGSVPTKKLNEMIKETRNYAFDFLKWKKAYELKKHYLVYNKKNCPCGDKVFRKHMGKYNRRTFFCEKCQILYD